MLHSMDFRMLRHMLHRMLCRMLHLMQHRMVRHILHCMLCCSGDNQFAFTSSRWSSFLLLLVLGSSRLEVPCTPTMPRHCLANSTTQFEPTTVPKDCRVIEASLSIQRLPLVRSSGSLRPS